MREPDSRQIAEEDRRMLDRQRRFRLAADHVARAFSRLPEVERVVLFGSVGVAHHEIDIFLLERGTGRYLGRLCCFKKCPAEKPECLAPGCGAAPFLRQHEGFHLDPNALEGKRTTVLYDRRS